MGEERGSSPSLEDEDQEQRHDETEDDDGLRDNRHQEALTEELRVLGHGSDGRRTNRLLTKTGTKTGQSDRETGAKVDHALRLRRSRLRGQSALRLRGREASDEGKSKQSTESEQNFPHQACFTS